MTNQLVLQNIAFTVSSGDVEKFFTSLVPVKHVELVTNSVTSRSYGVAVVSFESVTDAGLAVKELEGTDLADKPVHMDYATPELLASVRS